MAEPKPKPMHVLFVCTGNTCRSPLARFIFERAARAAGLPFSSDSAGLAGVAGEPMSEGARRALEARGIKGARHESQVLNAAMMARADAVYVMTQEHKRGVDYRFPEHKSKVRVLREAASLAHPDVDDPIGHPQAAYEACARQIEEALDILIKRETNAHSR